MKEGMGTLGEKKGTKRDKKALIETRNE